MPSSLILPRFTQVDAYGNPLVGGKLYTYANGTTTPQATYKDAAGTIANTNPIILDSLGSAVIFLAAGGVYTFVMKDANDALIWSQDSISGAQSASGGVSVVATLPTSDVGPVYMVGEGVFSWNGSGYVSDYSYGFGGGSYGYKNKIINGDFNIWQRGVSFTGLTAASTYVADRWRLDRTIGTWTAERSSTGSNFKVDGVGAACLRLTVTSQATPASADKNSIGQTIEGLDVETFAMGSLFGGNISLSFWVNSSIAGTYSGCIQNGGAPSWRSFVFTFQVGAANSWEKKTIVIPTDQGGTVNWAVDRNAGLSVLFDLGSGSNFEGAINTWLSTNTIRASGTVRLVSTVGAVFQISKIQLEQGNKATPFESIGAALELLRCQRFYQKSYDQDIYPGATSATAGSVVFRAVGTAPEIYVPLKVTMRTLPSIGLFSPVTGAPTVMRDESNSSDVSAVSAFIGHNNFFAQKTTSGVAGNRYSFHYVALAEF